MSSYYRVTIHRTLSCSYFITSLSFLTAVVKGQNNYSVPQRSRQRLSEPEYFAQSPQLPSWDSNPGECDPKTQITDGALRCTHLLHVLERLASELEMQELRPQTNETSRPACPTDLSQMMAKLYDLCCSI